MFPFESDPVPKPDDHVTTFRSIFERADAESNDRLDLLFPADWVHTTTGYSSFREFVDAGFDEYGAVTEIPDDELDEWIAEQSSFESWDEMTEAAANQWIEREF